MLIEISKGIIKRFIKQNYNNVRRDVTRIMCPHCHFALLGLISNASTKKAEAQFLVDQLAGWSFLSPIVGLSMLVTQHPCNSNKGSVPVLGHSGGPRQSTLLREYT